MLWAFIALALGVAAGALPFFPARALPWVSRLTTAGLALLLFTMGAGIGSDPTVLAGLGTIGVQAMAMALCTVTGSVAAVWLLSASGALASRGVCEQAPGRVRNAPMPVDTSGGPPDGHHGGSWTLTTIILASVAAGLAMGALGLLPAAYASALAPTSEAALALILGGIGLELGHNREAWKALRGLGVRALLVPAGIAAGSIAGGLAAGALTGLPANEAAAVSAGFGWYSLSGALLAQIYNSSTGALAFLSNVLRELIAVVAMPILARKLSPAAAMAPGGATTMDTTLPIIARSMGSEAALLAFASGATLTLLVPFLVPLLIGL